MISEITDIVFMQKVALSTVILGVVTGMFGTFTFLSNDTKLPFVIVAIGFVLIGLGLGYYFLYAEPLSDEIKESIRTENCGVLKTVYNTIDEPTYKDEIKNEYIMRCIADKESLEWLK